MKQRYFTKIFVALLVCLMPACNQDVAKDSMIGRTISEVEIRYTGDVTVSAARLKSLISSKSGSIYTHDSIDADVKALWDSGLVDDARFLVEAEGDSVRLIAEVSTRRPMGPPFCIGNSTYSDGELFEASGLPMTDVVSVEPLETARQKIKAFYITRGFVDVEVACRAFKGGDPSPQDYLFVVDEGSTVPQDSAQSKKHNKP
jgi:outer membrane protein assembly factor BamA